MDWLEIKEFLKDSIKYILFIIALLFVTVYVFGLEQVVGPSMNNTLNNNDVVILSKSHYKFFDVKRFDIISFYNENSKYLVKRVIGLPGESIKYVDNKLYINDEVVLEEYLTDTITDDFDLIDIGYSYIPDDMYFVLGDNRENSLDSRDKSIGLVKKSDIIGKVTIRIWPLNNINIVK